MPQIVLSSEQAEILTKALDPVEICDAKGRVVAVVPPVWTREDIAEANPILADPNTKWYTFDEVMAHLCSLGVK